jgi:hypothetical protein
MGDSSNFSSEYSNKSDAFVPSSLIFFSLKYAPVSSLKQQNQFHRLFCFKGDEFNNVICFDWSNICKRPNFFLILIHLEKDAMQCSIIIEGSPTAPNNTASVFKQRFNVCCGNEVPVLS